MKYIVMECHAGYSVLMDEDSNFLFAANLNYEVGQTVEHPILTKVPSSIQQTKFPVQSIVAAAACLLFMIGSGIFYYQRNFAVYSKVMISASADVCMQINRRGKVLSVESMNTNGFQLLQDYQAKGKDKLTVSQELIQKAMTMGYLHDGDTVAFYIDAPEQNIYTNYKTELEQEFDSYSYLSIKIEQYANFVSVPATETTTQTTTTEVTATTTSVTTTIPENTTIITETTIPEEIITEQTIITETAIPEEIITEQTIITETVIVAVPAEEPIIQQIPPDISEETEPVTETVSPEQPDEGIAEFPYKYEEDYPDFDGRIHPKWDNEHLLPTREHINDDDEDEEETFNHRDEQEIYQETNKFHTH